MKRKNYFLLLSMLLISFIGYSQEQPLKQLQVPMSTEYTDVVNNMESDTISVTFTTLYYDIKGVLTSLGETLKVGTEHVYGVLIKQQIVSSIIWLLVIILLTTVAIIMIKIPNNKLKEVNKIRATDGKSLYDIDDLNDGYFVATILGVMLFVITIIIFCCTISRITTGFINPEYGALQDIINMIK